MSKIERSIVAYKDDSGIYASSHKALKEQRKIERQKIRNQRIVALAQIVQKNKAYKRVKKENWNKIKKQLWEKAHSKNHYDEARDHLEKTRESYSDRDVKKYNEKIQLKNYRKLVRQHRKWR